MGRLILLIVLIITSGISHVYAENINPSNNRIFSEGEITTIELEMNEADKQALVYPDNPYQNTYYKATIRIENSQIDTIINTIGIRIRGNTSRNNIKKSFKIDFKEFGGGQVEKLKKLNLKPNTNDPSMVREPLSWLLYRKMNVPAARTSYVNLYINNEFMGIYQNVENIDDEFVDRRYGNEEGNLYKCYWGATLLPENDIYNDELFNLKTNEELNDRSKLEEFIDLLNEPVDELWVSEMEDMFDVPEYLRQMAVESMIGHWDGYSYNSNNFYLYDDPQSGKIHFIPYDLDNTWGIDWIGPDWAREDLTSWYSGWLDVALTKQLLKVDEFRDEYYRNIEQILEVWNEMEDHAWTFHNVIDSEVNNDLFYSLDRGFTYDDFSESIQVAYGDHVEYGIAEYIEKRGEYAKKQIENATSVHGLENEMLAVFPNPSNGKYINFNQTVDNALVYNSSGQIMETINTGRRIEFKTTLPIGIYFVKCNSKVFRFSVVH